MAEERRRPARRPQSRQEATEPQARWCQYPDGAHQKRRQVGRRQNLQSQERQNLQMLYLARGQQPEGTRLSRHVLRDPDLDEKVTAIERKTQTQLR